MQDETTTIELTIDKDLEDQLKDVLKFILFARRSNIPGRIRFKTNESLQMAVVVAIQTASNLVQLVTHNASECENSIRDHLGRDPFFNDEGEPEEPENVARKSGLSVYRPLHKHR